MSKTRPAARLVPAGLRVLSLTAGREGLRLRTETEAGGGLCPLCGSRSERFHSRYVRTISDLPWRGVTVALEVCARKFFCDRAGCERRIFCERLEEVAARTRKTARLEQVWPRASSPAWPLARRSRVRSSPLHPCLGYGSVRPLGQLLWPAWPVPRSRPTRRDRSATRVPKLVDVPFLDALFGSP